MMNQIKTRIRTLVLESRGETRVQHVFSDLTWAALGVALVGAIFAALGICTGGCTDAQRYRFFGLPFATMGIPFFVLLGVTSFGRNGNRPWIRNLYDALLAGILGAEWIFLGVQGRIIKHYCPVCVAIAIAVFVAVGLRLTEALLRGRAEGKGGKSVKRAALAFAKSMTVISAAYIGLLLALIGTSSPVSAGAGVITEDIWLGKADSQVEVLVVGDWYCPFCREVEPVVESTLPEIGKVAKYTFIDDPVHKESLPILPAHMSLLMNGKKDYHEGRKALLELAAQTKIVNPNDAVVALAKKGIKVSLVPEEGLKQLARSEAGFLAANAVTLTPTVVVRNNKTGKKRSLIGATEITKEKLVATVRWVSTSSDTE
ncbi:thioredoxin domain-containing protein [Geomonas subterranea]|uniref:thioredoxin domain-containing protein n=1 Tax=Geomonas subterranea TaxID=2847989 RepID=UPI001CD1F39A|nr:thioredoxin domain-containing protein [Geomonas fuzhouensis]